jgi:hypothetical protein
MNQRITWLLASSMVAAVLCGCGRNGDAHDDDETPKKSKKKTAAKDDDDEPQKKKSKSADDDDGEAPKKKSEPAAPKKPEPSSPKSVVMCGGKACEGVCCLFGGAACRFKADECPTATNGETTIVMCDGPEDCGGGQVCCYDMNRLAQTIVHCTSAAKCKGAQEMWDVHARNRLPF